jgi:hypothetical protein
MRSIGTSFRKVIFSDHLVGPPAAGSIAQGTRKHGDDDQNHIFFLRSYSIQIRARTGFHKISLP